MKLTATLNRHVLGPNDELECRVIMSRSEGESGNTSRGTENASDLLGFLTMEVCCVFHNDLSKASGSHMDLFTLKEEDTAHEEVYSIPSRGNETNIFTTGSIILACDTGVDGKVSRNYFMKCNIPNSVLPSFQGVRFGLKYVVRIVAQMARGKINTLDIPFFVFPSESYGYIHKDLKIPSETGEVEKSEKSFLLMNYEDKKSGVDMIESISQKRGSAGGDQILISNGGRKVARLSFENSTHELGEVIDCMIQLFGQTDSPCLSISCRLHNQITLDEAFLKEIRQSDKKLKKDHNFFFSDSTYYTKNLHYTHSQIPVPSRACVSLVSNIFSSVWTMRFSFIQADSKKGKKSSFEYEHPIIVTSNRRNLLPREILHEIVISP